MLYDKRWDKTDTKTDPLSLGSLIAWLETKSPTQHYDYRNCDGECLYGQYMASHGIAWQESGATGNLDAPKKRSDFCCLVYHEIARPLPWTFGAALERARAAVS
jgi:hypothetical protein